MIEMPARLKARNLCYVSHLISPEFLVNVGPTRYNSGMNTKWIKYTYVCHTCDGLFEMTVTLNRIITEKCPSCSGLLALLSVEDATITPTNEREQMFDNDEQVKALTEQRDNLASQVERLQNANSTYSKDASIQYGRINQVKEYLTENYDELQIYADEISAILQIELTREVTYNVVMNATITVNVPIGEDGEDILNDNLYIDANHGDVVIDSYDIDSIVEDC